MPLYGLRRARLAHLPPSVPMLDATQMQARTIPPLFSMPDICRRRVSRLIAALFALLRYAGRHSFTGLDPARQP
jgi:hypothetical protein